MRQGLARRDKVWPGETRLAGLARQGKAGDGSSNPRPRQATPPRVCFLTRLGLTYPHMPRRVKAEVQAPEVPRPSGSAPHLGRSAAWSGHWCEVGTVPRLKSRRLRPSTSSPAAASASSCWRTSRQRSHRCSGTDPNLASIVTGSIGVRVSCRQQRQVREVSEGAGPVESAVRSGTIRGEAAA